MEVNDTEAGGIASRQHKAVRSVNNSRCSNGKELVQVGFNYHYTTLSLILPGAYCRVDRTCKRLQLWQEALGAL